MDLSDNNNENIINEIIVDNDSEDISYFDSDEELDYMLDSSNENTGTDLFKTENYVDVDFINFPHIYEPFQPFITLINSPDIMGKIFYYICLDKRKIDFKNLIPFRLSTKENKYFVDYFMKERGFKFYHNIPPPEKLKIYIYNHSNSHSKKYKKVHYYHDMPVKNYKNLNNKWFIMMIRIYKKVYKKFFMIRR